MVDLELQSVTRVGLPEPSDFDFFAFRYRKDHPHDRHSGGTVDLDARNRIVRVGVLIGDSTDCPLQGGWFAAFLYLSVFHGAILLQRLNNRKPSTKIVGRFTPGHLRIVSTARIFCAVVISGGWSDGQ